MERRIGKITLYQHLDAVMLAQYVTDGDTILLEVERRYDMQDQPDTITAVLPVQFDDVTIDYMEALGRTIDAASFIHEKDAIVWVVNFDDATKTFDLQDSYVRDAIESGTGADVADGTELQALFTVPGLPASVQFLITLPYGEAFPSDMKDLMAENGLTVNASAKGSLFTIEDQKVQFTVVFYRPAEETRHYIIDYNKANQIIQV